MAKSRSVRGLAFLVAAISLPGASENHPCHVRGPPVEVLAGRVFIRFIDFINISRPMAFKNYLMSFLFLGFSINSATGGVNPGRNPKPDWIWRGDKTDDEPIYLRHKFEIKGQIKSASLYMTCDNGASISINGKDAGTAPDWSEPVTLENVTGFLKSGTNQIAVRAHNRGGAAAFVFKAEIGMADGTKQYVLSDTNWKVAFSETKGWKSAAYDDSGWTGQVISLGKFGVKPWGIPASGGGGEKGGSVTAVEDLQVVDGFVVDHIYTVPKDTQGSWVSLCRAPDGGFFACDQGRMGLFHILLTEDGPKVTSIELSQPGSKALLSGAQGLSWSQGSLWFHKNGGNLFRISDSNGDGKLDSIEAQPSSPGGGEHGNHAVIPDGSGKNFYVVGGNHAPIPPGDSISRTRIQSWQEDHLLPRLWDARGHARGRLAPGGWISKYDPREKKHDIYSIGMRNAYDVALNSADDLFIYDADMEWDVGSFWYRPTRINFAVSGSDYGWRSGTGKWPNYYEDSLPPLVEIGPGSPTGLASGKKARFPEKYQRAIYACDWTFGTIWAIHLKQEGAGYTATKESFVSGAPLPLTDATVGADGHFYFLVGGRGTQSGMYRVRHTGSGSTETAPVLKPTSERLIARSLEKFHGVSDAKAIGEAWPHLSSNDVFLRHAARVAIESQPVGLWISRLESETSAQAIIAASVALARSGEKQHQQVVLKSLQRLSFEKLTVRQKLGALRGYALAFMRLDAPTGDQRKAFISLFDQHLPSDNADLNTELIRVLTYLQSPTVVPKAIDLIKRRGKAEVPDWAELVSRNSGYGRTIQGYLDNPPPSREVYYVLMLANARQGWSIEARRACIEVLNEAGKTSGGASFPGFLKNIRDLHMAAMTNAERIGVADISGENFNPIPDFEIKPPVGPGQAYTLRSARKHLNFREASFENGRSLYFSTSCGACHRLAGLGGDIGPDLTSIPNKFDTGYVLEAMINPSKDISDQYGMFEVTLNDGTKKAGLFVQNGNDVSIYPPDHTSEPIKTTIDEVKSVKQLPISQMPAGLLNVLNPKELRDLMAYLMSGGDKSSKIYGKR